MRTTFRFEKRAEHIQEDDLSRLFADPPGLDKFRQTTSQLVVGAKGSGKSMLLKAHSLPVLQSTSGSPGALPFVGVYVGIKPVEADLLVQNFENTGQTDLPEHYLSLRILAELLRTATLCESASPAFSGLADRVAGALDLSSDRLHPSGFPSELSERIEAVAEGLVGKPDITFAAAALRQPRWPFSRLVRLLDECSGNLRPVRLPPLCMLFDGYDFLCDDLRQRLLGLLRKEYSFCTKVAARSMYSSHAQSPPQTPEWGRDFTILTVDHDADDPLYEGLCIHAAGAILRAQGNNATPAFIWGSADGQEYPYAGLARFIRISCGNIMRFLELCERSFDEAGDQVDFSRSPSVPFSKQTEAAVKLSRDRLVTEVAVDAGACFRELRSFIYWTAKAWAGDKQRRLGSNKVLSIKDTLGEPMASVLWTALMYRHLVCAPEEMIRLNITQGYLPMKFALNLGFTPRFKLATHVADEEALTADEVRARMQTPSPYDPEAHQFGKSGKAKEQPSLWADTAANPVFISHPMSLTGESAKKDRKRIAALKRAVVDIRRQELHDQERLDGINGDRLCITARDLNRLAPADFRKYVEQAIQRAPYIVHDVSVLKPGVVFEMGLAAAYRRPHFLFFNGDDERWDDSSMPRWIKGLQIKIFTRNRSLTSFREWFRSAFHSVANSLSPMPECRFSFTDTCRCQTAVSQAPDRLVYLGIPSYRNDITQIVRGIAAQEYQMVAADEWTASLMFEEYCTFCAAIRACACAVCYYDPADIPGVFALGMLQGLGKPRVVLCDRALASSHPIIMSTGQVREFSAGTLELEVGKAVRMLLGGMKGT